MTRSAMVLGAALALTAALSGCMTSRSGAKTVKAQGHCEAISFPIYFKSGSAQLTEPAEQAIHMAAQQAKGCKVGDIQVLGLADADGGAAVSQQVSEDRARVVAAALTQDGFPAPKIDATAAGSAGAKTATGAAVPSRRRAEVAINFQP